MAVIRVNNSTGFTVMSNYHLRDKNLSLKAKGLLSLFLSLPSDWDYSVSGLVAIVKESKSTIQTILKELEINRYLNRTKIQDEQGKFDYIYDIYEKPYTEKPYTEKPCTEKPFTESQSQINTNKPITKELNKEELNSYSRVSENEEKIKEIIQFLNEQASTHYRENSKNTRRNIIARLNEGFTVNDFYTVIKKKCDEWLGTEFEKFLNPDTLFCQKHFEKYLNQRIVKRNEFEGGLPF